MSDSDDQVIKNKQKVNNDQSAGSSKMFNTCAQPLLYETQSTDSNQSTQGTGDIVIEVNIDPGTSRRRPIMPVGVDNKAAERSRLYRERHREEINQRRRQIRQRQKKIQQIQTLSDIQKINEIEQITDVTSNNPVSSNSHAQRQQRYYERHKDELNKRKRDSRLQQRISQKIPAGVAEPNRKVTKNEEKDNDDQSAGSQPLLYEAQSTDSNQRVANTAAERNRLYRERHREEINQRRRDTRQRTKKYQQSTDSNQRRGTWTKPMMQDELLNSDKNSKSYACSEIVLASERLQPFAVPTLNLPAIHEPVVSICTFSDAPRAQAPVSPDDYSVSIKIEIDEEPSTTGEDPLDFQTREPSPPTKRACIDPTTSTSQPLASIEDQGRPKMPEKDYYDDFGLYIAALLREVSEERAEALQPIILEMVTASSNWFVR